MSAINSPDIWHGADLYIGTGAASASLTGSAGTKVGSIVSVGGDAGLQREVPSIRPMSGNILKKPGSGDFGTVEFNVLTDEDDSGMTTVNTAKTSTNEYPFYLKKGSATRQYVGYVQGVTDPGGDASSWMMKKITVALTKDIA